MNKKTKMTIGISIVALLLIVVGISYAYFSAQITGGESSTTVSVEGGSLGLTVNGGNTITVSNIYPTSDAIATKTFTISGTNTTTLSMPYVLNLVIDSNGFNTGSITYTLTSTNTDSNGSPVPSIEAKTSITTGSSTIELGSGYFKNGTNKVHTYTLNLYYLDTGSDQNSEQGKSISAHISVASEEAASEPDGWSTAVSGTLLNALKSSNSVTTPLTIPGQQISGETESEIASTADDYGTSYYFRGNVTNNYVVFANMCWRIVRVVGDGSIKIVLYNYNPNSVSNPCDTAQDGTTNAFARYDGTTFYDLFNTSYDDNAYIGFMYGTVGSSTYAETHANVNSSTIKTNLETWYTNTLSTYSSYLADTIWCNDKSLSTASTYLGYGTSKTYYNAYDRVSGWNGTGYSVSSAQPSLICPNDSEGGKLSKFTTTDTTNGNGNLTYPIGLLTADELAYAGGVVGIANSVYYLYQNSTGSKWWTLSPISSYNGKTLSTVIYSGYTNGGITLTAISGTYSAAIRPAISLKSTTTVIGTGTSSDPYVVQ